ncbi:MAG: VWA domain-containing protein [Clostridiales bacterium]|nr:VWA domain-containing protein [Clostridiales bacterium]
MSNISFDNPWLLFIALPLIAVVLVPFLIAVRRDNVNAHNIASLVIHAVICVCITLAFGGMKYESVVTETEVYVLADISYSAEHNIDDVQNKLEQVADKLPDNSRMGVICFARDFELVSDLGDDVPDITKVKGIDRSATDIGAALRYAGNLFDDNVIKRIIVITDGAETVSTNNVIKIVGTLQDDDVYIDAVYVDDNIADSVREVQIDGVDVLSSTYVGKDEKVDVLVRANCGVDGSGKLRQSMQGYVDLYRDGKLIEHRAPTFSDGLNVVSIDNLPTDAVGTFNYEVRVSTDNAGDDYSQYNNSYKFVQTVTDERKVLFLGGTQADVEAGRRIYGDDDATYITDVKKIPFGIETLCEYDEIVLSNFDVRTVPASEMFMSSLDALVTYYGKSLTTYGNTFIQENDGTDSALKKLQELLPVNIGNNKQDTRLFAIVLDISTSMNFSSRFAAAKGIAVSFIEALKPTDTVMVIGFSGGVTELLPPTPLNSKKVIQAVIERINAATTENETNLSAALRHTYDLMPSRFHDKRVVIISDGLNPSSDNVAAKEIANTMSQGNIAVSALGVYADASGSELLDSLVHNPYAVSGAFYQNLEHESRLDVLIEELREDMQDIKITGDRYAVTVRRPDYGAVRGIDNIGAVNGFWYNYAKSDGSTRTVLDVEYFRDKVTSFDVPLYAYWSCGNGKVASFMSDIASDWIGGWADGTGGRKFLSAIPDATLPDVRIKTPFIVETESSGGQTVIKVTASETLPNITDFKVVLTDPDGMVSERTLAFGSGVYVTTFSTDMPGIYSAHIVYENGELKYSADVDFTISYYAEYDSFASYNKTYLYRLLTENGQVLDLDGIDAIENSDSEYTSYVVSFTMPLMIICVVLFVADIIIRQLKWKDVSSFFKGLFGRRK